ncbi:amidase [Chondromyces apiculatus]|uniref:Glutamyl-tRNA(Gln) amidotransferase subunit A n=1 Tax=Chondromyces apiculatus DSM 436 TaxID=1192034 RepID=A0A017TEZ3_9BACT|nr:amidase [Chondromyces apiculatus]EYF07868.1 Glutamyl-tRNA(Gln) amidotransferase subunit A [Chondromyces apiculatus DSM 436]
MLDPLLLLSATRLAALVRAGDTSSEHIVDVHIRHIERVNPVINAMVAERFDTARAEARAADVRRRQEPPESLPPFHGVPCSIKESFAVTGMPNTAGLLARKALRAREDAITVTRLRNAGFIPLGVTNTPELCMWMESNNRVYGCSNNPYDPRRTVGGSSGGEGAIVGAGGAPVGLGSDIAGSIRMPAFFNGVFGHKPTGGLVPSSGQFPRPTGGTLRYITTGPITRRAEDLMPLLALLAGPHPDDPACISFPLGDPGAIDLRALTVHTVESDGLHAVHPELLAAQRRAAEVLGSLGATVRPANLTHLSRTLEIWSAMVAAGNVVSGTRGPSFAELLGEGRRISVGREMVRLALGRSPHTLPAVALAFLEDASKLLPGRMTQAAKLGEELRAEIAGLLGDSGVLLYPSHPVPAPRHGHSLYAPLRWAYTAIFNVMELPVTQVPLGLGTEGLPLGVQVVAPHAHDHLSIAVAGHLEAALGGWIPPSLSGPWYQHRP